MTCVLEDQLYLSNGFVAHTLEQLNESKIEVVINVSEDKELKERFGFTQINHHVEVVEYVLYPLPDVPANDFDLQPHLGI
jgi:hypothetical protein